jgi:hypothetical protein
MGGLWHFLCNSAYLATQVKISRQSIKQQEQFYDNRLAEHIIHILGSLVPRFIVNCQPAHDRCFARLRAERKAGKLLAEMEKAKGTRGAGRPALGSNTKEPPKEEGTPTLLDLGISKKQSSDWQKAALRLRCAS